MNLIKVDSVKFLMNMFISTNNVPIFKRNVETLIQRGQIEPEVRDIIYNIYGIANTDVYKPSMQRMKLLQLDWLMMEAESRKIEYGDFNTIEQYKKFVENGCKTGSFLKSVRDIIFSIYDLDESVKSGSSSSIGRINIDRPPTSQKVSVSKSQKTGVQSKEVLADIAKIKPEYIDKVYYEYDNPTYDGCSGSHPYVHVSLKDAEVKPEGAKLVQYVVLSDDGCHRIMGYRPIPDIWLKPKTSKSKLGTLKGTNSSTYIKTPSSSPVGCSGGGPSRVC